MTQALSVNPLKLWQSAPDNGAPARFDWPERVLPWLPLCLFFPVGIMYAGLLAFYLALLLAGGWRQRWQHLKQHPMLIPVLTLSAISVMVALGQDRSPPVMQEFWPAFGHYQTYLFLLPMLLVPAGQWQQRSMAYFQRGALLAASIFVASALHVLPEISFFHSYQHYVGNKSILLGILLAIAAGWTLDQWLCERRRHWQYGLKLLFLVAVMLLLSKTRTASLLFVLLALLSIFSMVRWSWRQSWIPLLLAGLLWGGWQAVYQAGRPANCVINTVQAEAWQLAQIRARCTMFQAHDLLSGRKSSDDDGMRTEIYRITAAMVAEQPWRGHGIAAWMPEYQQRAAGLVSASMTTPHNDYLLYATELGLPGLLTLLLIWLRQLQLSWQMSKAGDPALSWRAMPLTSLTLAMMVGGMFNAILRDAVFGLAFMILLAIPLAGLQRPVSYRQKA